MSSSLFGASTGISVRPLTVITTSTGPPSAGSVCAQTQTSGANENQNVPFPKYLNRASLWHSVIICFKNDRCNLSFLSQLGRSAHWLIVCFSQTRVIMSTLCQRKAGGQKLTHYHIQLRQCGQICPSSLVSGRRRSQLTHTGKHPPLKPLAALSSQLEAPSRLSFKGHHFTPVQFAVEPSAAY